MTGRHREPAPAPDVVRVVCFAAGLVDGVPPVVSDGVPIDRLVLRSEGPRRCDIYAVFERRHDEAAVWWQVTGDLSLGQLDNWPAHRRADQKPSPRFQAWMDTVAVGIHRAIDGLAS